MTGTADGWETITDALDLVHPGAALEHWGTTMRFIDGGPDPLDGVSAYLVPNETGGAAEHWHYVSYGLSDLYGVGDGVAGRSGRGFEFTFRLRQAPEGDGAPIWPANLLQSAARYVVDTDRQIEPGHLIDLKGPLGGSALTALRALLFVADPQLGDIRSGNGRVRFVQLAGITSAELDAARRWNTEGMAVLLQSRDPLFVTDLMRPDLLDEPAMVEAVRAGIERDGSSTDVLVLTEGGAEIGIDGLTVVIARDGVDTFLPVLAARLHRGQTLSIASRVGDLPVLFHYEPPTPQDDEEGHWVASSEIVEVWLTERGLTEMLDGLSPTPGQVAFPSIPSTTFDVL